MLQEVSTSARVRMYVASLIQAGETRYSHN